MRTSITEHKLAAITRLDTLLDDASHPVNASLPLSTILGANVPKEIAVEQHVNVLLVGVARARSHYTARAVEPWFRHIAHALPHVLAPVGVAQTTTERVETPHTALSFNVSISFVELSPRVSAVLEEVLLRHIRAEAKLCASPDATGAAADSCNVHRSVLGDPDLGTERYYVDAARFSAVLADLLASLALDRSFSLFVLNLKSPVDKEHATYGYRVGFSQAEIEEIRANTSALSLPQKAYAPKRWSDAASQRRPEPQSAHVPPPRFVSKVTESDAWANRITEVLFKARALRAFEIGSAAERATAESTYGVSELRRLASVCSDIDPNDLVCVLRAEPAAHGSTFDMVAEIAALGTEDERRYVQQLLRDNSGLIRGDCLVDAWVSHDRLAFVDLGAGPLDWGPTVAAAGVKTFESFPSMPSDELVERELASNVAQRSPPPTTFANASEAFAESSLLAVYRNLHCFYGIDSVCAQLAERVQQLQSSPLQSRPWLARAASDSFAAESSSSNTSASEDEFLSELAHVVLGIGVRQLFLPPASLFSPVLDSAVSFHLFVVSDHSAYAAVDELTFDWQRVRGELQALRLPYQEFGFRVTTVSLSDEARIVAALAASLRTATLPSLDAEGMFHAVPTRYIDSATLQERLEALHIDGDTHGTSVDPTRHINLFLFSIGDETPLLIDKYFQAKALENAVLIVQSNSRNFSSRFACNGALVDVDLRNPTHATLGALGTLLGGLVPAHIQYEPTRSAASQDWRWAVGARPNVAIALSPLARYGALARDITLRNAAMAAVTESLQNLQALQADLDTRKLSVALARLAFMRHGMRAIAVEVAAWIAAVDFVVDLISQMRFEDAVVAARELRELYFSASANLDAFSDVYDRMTCVNNADEMRNAAPEARRALMQPDEQADAPAAATLPRATPAIALPLVPWRSSVISVLLIVQLAALLGYGTWRFWTAGAHARNKVKVN